MRILYIICCLFILTSCIQTAPPLPKPSLKPQKQSMTYLYRSQLPWSYAGMPLAQKVSIQNRYEPQFSLNPGSRDIVSGGTLNLEIGTWRDADGDQISFWWKSNKGQFVFWNETATYVRWQAPVVSEDTKVPLWIYASDGRGKTTEQVAWIIVRKLATSADIITDNLRYYPVVAPRPGEPPVFYPGEDIRVEWMTTNASNQIARYLSMCIWLTPQMRIPLSPAGEFLNIGNLDPGEQKLRYTNFYIPKSTPTGDYYLAFFSDCEHSITENNEENNKMFLAIRIRPQGSPRR